MSDVAIVCERWGMELRPPESGQTWFLNWVLRSPEDVSTHLSAGWHAYAALAEVVQDTDLTATEYFGGMGAQALMIDHFFHPSSHVIQDYSDEAVAHLYDVFPGTGKTIVQADAYNSEVVPADIVGLDFGDLTVWKTRDGEPHRRLLDDVFFHAPVGVVLTDIAGPRLHLQRERYETLLGMGSCASYEMYLYTFAERIRDLYGYVLVKGFSHRWSTVMTFVADDGILPGPIVPVPSSPIGLELT